jgi:hypothetical protein
MLQHSKFIRQHIENYNQGSLKTYMYHAQKLKGRIKIYVYQTKEASKVEKSWTSYAHLNAANFILDLLFLFLWGQTKYSKEL